MGLDIAAFKNLSLVENPEIDEDGELINWETEWMPGASMVWSEENFPGRGQGIDPNAVYKIGEEYRFPAGSYHGYNWWRSNLEIFSDGNSFVELINFADNEGIIGPIVSNKLYSDFVSSLEKAEEFSKTLGVNGEWWFKKYNDWMKAFEYAKQNGAVDFH